MALISELRQNLSDARKMGAPFLLRHFARREAPGVRPIRIARFGSVYARDANSDLSVIRQIFKYEHYALERSVMARARSRYQAILDEGKIPTIVDAGANIGVASIWFHHTFQQSQIVAVEPEPSNFAVLRRNARPGIMLVEAAVGGSPGFVQVRNEGHGWAAQTERSNSGTPVVTMNDTFGSIANGVPFIAKIDIEGFESELFTDNLEWLDKVSIVYIEPHDWLFPGRKTSRPFQRAMADRDFDLLIYGENLVYIRC